MGKQGIVSNIGVRREQSPEWALSLDPDKWKRLTGARFSSLKSSATLLS